MPSIQEILHLLVLSFFMGCAYKAVTAKVKRRLTTLLVSLLLALPFYLALQETPPHVSAPYYPWGAVLPLSIGVIEAVRMSPKPKRLNVRQ
jgi:uncharacterized integral membrane protein